MSSFNELNNKIVEEHTNSLAKYLYGMASIVEGDRIRWETYMDAADALMDVIRLWAEDEADPTTGAPPTSISITSVDLGKVRWPA